MQHACRKQKAMLQRAKIRRLRHTRAIMGRHEAPGGRDWQKAAEIASDLHRGAPRGENGGAPRGENGGAGRRYLSSP
jgi:hypothetical protein